jgi:hypothetical protein
MDLPTLDDSVELDDPIDLIEAVLASDDRFVAERGDDEDISFSARGAWSEITGFFAYRDELPALMMTISFELRAPKAKRNAVARLVALVNETLWLGHFDLWSEDGSVVFRHTLPLIGREDLTAGEIQALLAAAMEAGDRFYPAFNFLIWADKSPEEALAASMFETAGEA